MNLNDDPIIELEGFLEKQGARGPGKKKYKRRYFKLQKEGQLHYYASPKDVAKRKGSLGYIDLNLVSAVEQVSGNEVDKRLATRKSVLADAMHFDVVTEERTFRLVAATTKDLIRWTSGLMQVIEHLEHLRATGGAAPNFSLADLDRPRTPLRGDDAAGPEEPVGPLEVRKFSSPDAPKLAEEEAGGARATRRPTLPSSQLAPGISSGGVPGVNAVRGLLAEIGSGVFEVQVPAELENSLQLLQDLQNTRSRQTKDAGAQQVALLTRLQELPAREAEVVGKLCEGRAGLDRAAGLHTTATERQQEASQQLQDASQALEAQLTALEEAKEELTRARSQSRGPSEAEHSKSVAQLQEAIASVPQRKEELQRALEVAELEVTGMRGEQTNYEAQLEQLAADKAAVEERLSVSSPQGEMAEDKVEGATTPESDGAAEREAGGEAAVVSSESSPSADVAAAEKERADIEQQDAFLSGKSASLLKNVEEKKGQLEQLRAEYEGIDGVATKKEEELEELKAAYARQAEKNAELVAHIAAQEQLVVDCEQKLATLYEDASSSAAAVRSANKAQAEGQLELIALTGKQKELQDQRLALQAERASVLRDLEVFFPPAAPSVTAGGPKEEEATSKDSATSKELEKELAEAKAHISLLKEENQRLKVKVGQQNEQLDVAAAEKREEEEAALELKSRLEEFQDKLRNSSVGQLEMDLSAKEQDLAAVTELYRNLEMETKLYDTERTIDRERVRQQNEEIKAKDRTIQQLSERLQTRVTAADQTPTSAKLYRELARLRAGNHAHQAQNSQLEVELSRLQTCSQAELEMRDRSIAHLNMQLEAMRADYQALRHQALTKGGVDAATTRELDSIAWVKERYFFSLAVGVKLNLSQRGTPVNLDVAELYDEARFTVDVREWENWIYQRISEVQPVKLHQPAPQRPAPRRTTSMRAPSPYSESRTSSPHPSNW